MNAIADPGLPRAPLHGVRQIARFNWPLYVAAAVVAALAAGSAVILPLPAATGAALCIGAALAAFWIVSSLAASWAIYDRSPLRGGAWVEEAAGFRPENWVAIHVGFDELTPVLGTRLGSHGRVFDIYDPRAMTEASISRARAAVPSRGAEAADPGRLPIPSGSVDLVVLPLSAHELRTDASRRVLFGEVHRVLTPAGRAVVAEHLRDVANLLAFGPGAFHFHSERTWRRCFRDARLEVCGERSVTPFVHVFVLRRSS